MSFHAEESPNMGTATCSNVVGNTHRRTGFAGPPEVRAETPATERSGTPSGVIAWRHAGETAKSLHPCKIVPMTIHFDIGESLEPPSNLGPRQMIIRRLRPTTEFGL